MEMIEVEQDETANLHFKFPPAPHSGKVTLKVNEVSKSYDELEVLKGIDLLLERGEKIAFVGKNGEGKTTLAKIIVDSIPFEGQVGIRPSSQSRLLRSESV